ncbi:hypothetical protein BT93_L4725 [Corymbia citriodora subsp. variegata]|uniref:Inositol-1-monophosphatase n=1 Tax=Corymbia citriodora subsp. variegata TaxID=360336 RepID=A0A8T0CFJ1_CORYI|nr:hypothetical protein BT93_L4725 [Corymbia citriodora subsp. variegata]
MMGANVILDASAKMATGLTTTVTDTKNNSADLVTETDKAVEDLISRTLLKQFPDFSFMGEETYKPGTPLGPEPTFICDPIDGTTNFVHGYPYVSISLGFAINREPVVGVVFNPFTGVMYAGVKGRGAFKMTNERDDTGGWGCKRNEDMPTRAPKPLTGLNGTVVIVEWGSDRSGSNWKSKIATWDNLGRSKEEGGAMVHSGRSLGSAALNLCAVAEGNVDAYWEGGCWAWDVCAGWVILKEAGGMIVDGNPGTWDIPVTHRKYLAVRGASSGQKECIEEFWSHVVGDMVYEH